MTIVFVWWAYVTLLHTPSYLFPGPDRVFHALTARGWAYLPDVWTTSQEVIAGFGLGLAAGAVLAVVLASSHLGVAGSTVLRQAIYPLLIGSQMVPLFVVAPIVTIIFQYGLLPQIIVTALYSFFPVVVNVTDGLGRAEPELVNLLRSAGASGWRVFRMVRAPMALPALFSGAKLAMIFAVSGAAIAEFIGGQSGLGYEMRFQNGQFDVPGMFATVVVLTVLGASLFALLSVIEYFAIPWMRRAGGDIGDLWRGSASTRGGES